VFSGIPLKPLRAQKKKEKKKENAAQVAELSPSLDRVQKSTGYTRDFSPTSR